MSFPDISMSEISLDEKKSMVKNQLADSEGFIEYFGLRRAQLTPNYS